MNLPRLPPELVGKILAKTGIPYDEYKFSQVLTRAIREYTMLEVQREQMDWQPICQWVRSVLTMVKTVTIREDGHPNQYDPNGAMPVPDRLLSCWPAHWFYYEPNEPPALMLNEQLCAEIAGDNPYSFHTGHAESHELVIFYRGQLPVGLTRMKLILEEMRADFSGLADDQRDTYIRDLEMEVQFMNGDVYRLLIEVEQKRDPSKFRLGVRRTNDRDPKDMTGSGYLHQLMLFLRCLLTMEQAPYLKLHLKPGFFQADVIEYGLDRLGVIV